MLGVRCKGESKLFKWFRRRKKPYDECQILNDGLDYAMEFGSNWLQPIHARLVRLYPELSESELDNYNSTCKTAMTSGHDQVYALVEEFGKNTSFDMFSTNFTKSFPWVNKKNVKHIFLKACITHGKIMGGDSHLISK